MYKELLQSIEGIEIYPLISLFIFLLLFVGVIIWIVRLDKSYINEMETMPFANDEDSVKLSGRKS